MSYFLKSALCAAALALSGCVVSTSSSSLPSAPVGATMNLPIPESGQSVNAYRQAAGLAPLARSSRLDSAARAHAQDMNANGFFSHTGSNGSSHTSRIRAYGCTGGAENIAQGPYNAQTVMAAWMNSAGHRRNILLPTVTNYGLANVGPYWVMVLSRNCP